MVPEPIDVVVCTWNSESHLAECLRAVRANLPVATLWVIDRFSTDGTLAICEAFGCRVVQEDCNLGLARKLGIDCVTTDVFAFVDSDYVVCDGWFDPIYDLEPVDPADPQLAPYRSFWCYGISYHKKTGKIEDGDIYSFQLMDGSWTLYKGTP